MNKKREPFIGWPGWKHLGFAIVLMFAGFLWFGLVYGFCDAITAQRSFRLRIHFGWETAIPFVPETIVFYMSIYLLFLLAPFIEREQKVFLMLAMTLNAMVLVAGICFLLFPAQLAFAPPPHLGTIPGLFRLADDLNLTYNLAPSLHVALSVGCVDVFARKTPFQWIKISLWLWAGMIALSTLLTHQHHLLDVLTGFLLAKAMVRLVFNRRNAAPAFSVRTEERETVPR